MHRPCRRRLRGRARRAEAAAFDASRRRVGLLATRARREQLNRPRPSHPSRTSADCAPRTISMRSRFSVRDVAEVERAARLVQRNSVEQHLGVVALAAAYEQRRDRPAAAVGHDDGARRAAQQIEQWRLLPALRSPRRRTPSRSLATCASGASVRVAETTIASWMPRDGQADPDILPAWSAAA